MTTCWTLDKPMASLPTCHLLFALDGNRVRSHVRGTTFKTGPLSKTSHKVDILKLKLICFYTIIFSIYLTTSMLLNGALLSKLLYLKGVSKHHPNFFSLKMCVQNGPTFTTRPLSHFYYSAIVTHLLLGHCHTFTTRPLSHIYYSAIVTLLLLGHCHTFTTRQLSHFYYSAIVTILLVSHCHTFTTRQLSHFYYSAIVSLLLLSHCHTFTTRPLSHFYY